MWARFIKSRAQKKDPDDHPDYWNKFAVMCKTAALAQMLHSAILAAAELPETAAQLNKFLDTTPYDEPSIEKPAVTLATSELQFETKNGVLPLPS